MKRDGHALKIPYFGLLKVIILNYAQLALMLMEIYTLQSIRLIRANGMDTLWLLGSLIFHLRMY